jgi:hypothetical protein
MHRRRTAYNSSALAAARPAQALDAAEAEAARLREALEVAEAGAPPSARAFIALERRIALMAGEAAAPPAGAGAGAGGPSRAAAAEEGRRAAEAELQAERRRHAAELALRDAAVAQFRAELEDLLAAARSLQLCGAAC